MKRAKRANSANLSDQIKEIAIDLMSTVGCANRKMTLVIHSHNDRWHRWLRQPKNDVGYP